MKPFTVLSHNVFWFQGVPFLTDTPPAPDVEVLKRLCAIYQARNPDVICLQEIQSRETFEQVSRNLGMTGCYCPGSALPQYGGAVFWRADSGREVRNSREAAVKTQRMWQMVEVHGGVGRVQICNIHLPSERQLGPVQSAAQRKAELEDSIRNGRAGPDLIVGDFNEQPAGPVAECLEQSGYLDAAVVSDQAGFPTTIGGARGDYIWISRKMGGDCMLTHGVARKQEPACQEIGKTYLSDHLPLWLTQERRK
jgi:exonuclease III